MFEYIGLDCFQVQFMPHGLGEYRVIWSNLCREDIECCKYTKLVYVECTDYTKWFKCVLKCISCV